MSGPADFQFVEHLPALQVVVPLIGSALTAVAANGRLAWLITAICCWSMPFIAFGMLDQVQATGPISYAMGGWAPPVGIEFRVDQANALLLVLVSLMAALIISYAPRSIDDEIRREGQHWYYTMFLLCLCGLQGMAISGDAFNIFVFMEVSSLATYVLIALGRDRRALLASYQYLVIGTVGATFYVIGVGLLFSVTGSLNLFDIAGRLADTAESRALFAGLAFIVVGLGLKIALFPMHLWLPNAYAFAPSVASAFLASTATKVAVYVLLRFLFSVYGVEIGFAETPASAMFAILAVLGMLVAAVVAVFEENVKRMLAYSSVSQIGYIMLGIALVSQAGLIGGVSHLFNHAIIKACLFLSVGCMAYATGVTRIAHMAGIGRTMPMTMAAFVIAGLGLIGVPGTAGFISKWYLILGAAEQGAWWLVVVIVVSSIIAVFYVGRVVEVAWFREPKSPVDRPLKVPVEMSLLTWVLALAVIYFGIDTDLTVGVSQQVADVLLGGYRP